MNSKENNLQPEQQKIELESKTPINSIRDWLLIFFLTIIPLIGFILLIVWAFDEHNKNRKNWAIATLIWIFIIFSITAIFFGSVFSSILDAF